MKQYQWKGAQFEEIQPVDFTKEQGVFRTFSSGAPLAVHQKRLDQEAKALGLRLAPFSREKLPPLEGRVRLIVTPKGTFLTMTPFEMQRPRLLKAALFLKTTPVQKVKGLDYSHRHALQQRALDQGADLAIEVDARGVLLEASYSNLLWEEEGKWFTPNPYTLPIYFGVSIEQKIRQGMEIAFVEKTYTELGENARLYICNSLRGMQQVIV